MARGRMLSTDACSDPELHSISVEAMALYLLTIPNLDRDGLIDANPLKILAVAAPLRFEFRDRAGALINEWCEAGLVIRYVTGPQRAVLFFKGFRRHQQGMEYGREPASRFPPPPGWRREKDGMVPDDPELCFRLSEAFHPKSSYRAALLAAAQDDAPTDAGDLPGDIANTSRSVRDVFAPKRREENYGGGGVQTYMPHTPGSCYGGGTGGVAGVSDDRLRIAVDTLAQPFGLPMEFNGWPRAVSGWNRDELCLVLAWLVKWQELTAEQFDAIRSLPAVLRQKISAGEWPHLRKPQIDGLLNQIDDALALVVETGVGE